MGRKMSAKLTFFCEMKAEGLLPLFNEFPIIDDLVALNASVSMGIVDFGSERAEVVRRLNRANVPVNAWLLLPEEEGYWFNIKNADKATERYEQLKAWAHQNGLKWTGLGMDIEPDYREMEDLMQGRKRLIFPILRRFLDRSAMRHANVGYWKLISQMKADGYYVYSYHFPFIVDERRVGSTWLQQLAGLVDVPTDRDVLMLYTSMFRPHGPGMLWSYAGDAESVGVGSTGGGVQIKGIGDIPPLDWVEFSRDLRLARRWTEDIHVFSLEGCVHQGFMERLKDFDWDGPVTIPLGAARRVRLIRMGLQAILWLSVHPILFFLGAFLSSRLVSRLLRRVR
jgi:hypothetical protein